MAGLGAYWWKGRPNFGDALTHWLLDKVGAAHQWADATESDIVVTGSVLEHLPNQWAGTVMGAGTLYPPGALSGKVDLSSARVLALRGKLTAKAVGAASRVVLGDPGLLASRLIGEVPEVKHDLGIIAHWSDKRLTRRYPWAHIIDAATDDAEHVVREIASCRAIISSSLHGLIVADSFGIPRRAELFNQAASEGGDWKFRDYASVFDTHPHFGEFWTAPADIVARIIDELLNEFRHFCRFPHHDPQISLLVPFRDDGEHRDRVWNWLERYWQHALPSAEIVMGRDFGVPFSKAIAVNDAASRARGHVFAVLDADAYIHADAIESCAYQIEEAQASGQRKWFMPYNKLYRLDRMATMGLLESDPAAPFDVPSPPPLDWVEPGNEPKNYGYGPDPVRSAFQFGAMCQVVPREAFELVGGMDPRFRGWGSEDASFKRSLDTLYCKSEIAVNDMLHMWHARPTYPEGRRWIGQATNLPNRDLGARYGAATGRPAFMQKLIDERSE